MTINNKCVLITGADGFIGSHLTEALCIAGYNVTALVQYNSFNNWGWLENINCKDAINVVAGDIRDTDFCHKITHNIDIIFHMAALIAIPYSYVAPQSYIDTNVSGTLNICQAALKNEIQRIIITSTSEVYGTAQYVPIDETHPLQPQSPYSASKISADAIASSFYYSFNLPVTIARPFNTYGPRQSSRAIIPTIISQIISGQKSIKLGDLSPTRDFNYVLDICQGFIDLAQCDKAKGQTVNLGSGQEISIKRLLSLIKDIMNTEVEIIEDKERFRPKSSEVYRLLCDNKLAKKLINYKASHTLREGLEETIKWLAQPENHKKYKVDIYNV